MRLVHVATAASIDPAVAFEEEQRIDEDENILDIVGSLIKINKETDVVELIHISVTQFLTQSKLPDGKENPYYLDEAESNALLMKACFMYLCLPSFSTTVSELRDSQSIVRQMKLRFRDEFSVYAVREWSKHAKKIEQESKVRPYIFKFLKGRSFLVWREMWELGKLHSYQWSSRRGPRHEKEILWSEDVVCELQSAARWDPGSPLYYAALFDLQSVAELLLVNNDPNECGGPESYPLLAALKNGHVIMAKLLLQFGANINVKHRLTEDTALHRAIKAGDQLATEFLIEKGADPGVSNLHGLPPLHLAVQNLAAQKNSLIQGLIKLIGEGSNIDIEDGQGNAAIHVAANKGCCLSISTLLEQGANVNAINRQGKAALHLASRKGYLPAVEALLRHKAICVKDHMGDTPLHEAMRSGNPKLVSRILQESRIPLDWAQFNVSVHVVSYMY